VLDARLEGLAGADDRLRLATLRRSVGVGIQGAVLSLFAGAATVAALLAGFGGLSGGSLPGPDFAVIVLVPMAVFEIFA
ncbi:thiol reductant ABC exporter subunit CydC, partial [Cryobacterium sp. 10I1]|nr:thiol reductant ABC exporter subunit CydC [Cryobacterium sp. 10I1]